jgi:hypothetical protein
MGTLQAEPVRYWIMTKNNAPRGMVVAQRKPFRYD